MFRKLRILREEIEFSGYKAQVFQANKLFVSVKQNDNKYEQ